MISLLIDLILAGLLVATLVYGAMLNRRLTTLRQDRDQLAAVIIGLNDATARALAGMEGLKQAADTNGRSLQSTIERARGTVEDLSFLVERGEKAAERLEAATRPELLRASKPTLVPPAASGPTPPVGPARPPRPVAAVAAPRPVPTVEEPVVQDERRDLLKTLQEMR